MCFSYICVLKALDSAKCDKLFIISQISCAVNPHKYKVGTLCFFTNLRDICCHF